MLPTVLNEGEVYLEKEDRECKNNASKAMTIKSLTNIVHRNILHTHECYNLQSCLCSVTSAAAAVHCYFPCLLSFVLTTAQEENGI